MKNKFLLFTLLFFISVFYSKAQNYEMSAYANNSVITTCKGTFTYTGGYYGVGGYGNNINKTITFCSGTPGVPIRISFIDWDVESGYDFIRIYDGTGTGGTLLGTITGTDEIFSANSSSSFYTSTGTCLTVQFTSDVSITGFGWDALIGCAPQNCGNNSPANNSCSAAPQICDLNGYCGNTSGWYTRDNGQIDNTSSGSGLFCGSIENNSWISFIASATTATLNVNSSNCAVAGSGIQAEVFETTNCSSFTSKSNCVSQNTGSGNFTLTATGLTVGTKYYVMIDGYAGNICDYTVTANTGVQVITLTSNPTNATICRGQTATISVNNAPTGTTYSWTPTGSIVGASNGATITVNPTTTTTYSCTITLPNGCGTQIENYTITVNQPTTPTFTQLGAYCVGATPGTLLTTSSNGITGTWNPATISTATAGNSTYTFTPSANNTCATTATMNVTVNQNVTPTFTQLGAYCVGATPGTLLTTSSNGITGTWNPATISTASAGNSTYTFTPSANNTCATTATMNVTVNQNVTPTFTQLGAYCVGATPGTLLTTSNNGITGTWNPATISTATAGNSTYTFTPSANNTCATTATMNVVVNQNVTPTFTQLGAYCVGATPGTLLTTSSNGIAGTWNPATISTATAGNSTYTFTPSANNTCATTATMNVTVNQNVTPTFTQLGAYCVGATPGTLLTTSSNGITGTWNPATISTATAGNSTYTFTPSANNTCATTATMNVTVNNTINTNINREICQGQSIIIGNEMFNETGNYSVILQSSQGCDSIIHLNLTVNPTYNIERNEIICQGQSISIGTQTFNETGNYTVTLQTQAGCDSIIYLALTVNPTYDIQRTESICAGQSITIGDLVFNETGNYTIEFRTTEGCDSIIHLNLTVNPTYNIERNEIICQGQSITIGTQTFNETGNYTVTLQTNSGCDSIVNLALTVNPTYDLQRTESICAGQSITIGTQTFNESGNYTVTLQTQAGCDSIINLALTVNPTYRMNRSETICYGQNITIGSQTFNETGNYTVAFQTQAGCDSVINLALTVNPIYSTLRSESICQGQSITIGSQTFNETGNYTVTLQTINGCDSIINLALTVNPIPVLNASVDTSIINTGQTVQLNAQSDIPATFNWQPIDIVSNSTIANPTASPLSSTWFVVTATATEKQCVAIDSVFVTVNELECSKKYVFIPNAFTPNNDGVNDIFIPRSTILKSMRLIVFDRWGNQVFESNDLNVGWDGVYKNKLELEDSYGYYFVGECSQGGKIIIKGNVTLMR